MADMNEWVDRLLRKVIDENQFIDGDTSYMPDDALDETKQQITAKMQEIEREAAIRELKRLQEVKFNEKALNNSAIYMYAFDRIAELSQKEGA